MKVKPNLAIGYIFGLIIVVLAGSELFARYKLGLGNPPIYIAHPSIEYMLKPNQDVHRFGNHVYINQYGMRSKSFHKMKQGSELRVVFFGDSVLNGGSQADHNDLATTIVEENLRLQQRNQS